MAKNLLSYLNYKDYLVDKLETLSKQERGLKQKVAAYIGCQASYLSQILKGKPDLTLDQAHQLNQFFLHDKLESRYFIILVELGRASSKPLKDFFLEQIKELQQSQADLKNRLRETDEIAPELMNKYYSTWLYTAIHMALAIPELQDVRKIASKFNIPLEMANSIIHFLETSGLIEKQNNQYVFTKMRIHLNRHSDFIQRHHINWRSQSLQSVEKNFPEDLHFSTVFAISQSDFNNIKEIFIKSIESARKIIRPSLSEEVCAITLDIFKL